MEGLADCQPGSYTDLYGFIVDFKPVKKSTKGAGGKQVIITLEIHFLLTPETL